MRTRLFPTLMILAGSLVQAGVPALAQGGAQASFVAPGEFEPQEYIWLSWVEKSNLGSAPFSDVALEVMRAITPYVRVRLMYSRLTAQDASFFGPYRLSQAEAEVRLRTQLEHEGIDLSRVDLFYFPQPGGATNVIWLKQGPADEAWGRLPDGRWGIGTGGHVDVFARFADAQTILLAQVGQQQRDSNPILRETHARMEENFRILSTAKDEAGRPFRILRVPVPDTMTASIAYDSLSRGTGLVRRRARRTRGR